MWELATRTTFSRIQSVRGASEGLLAITNTPETSVTIEDGMKTIVFNTLTSKWPSTPARRRRFAVESDAGPVPGLFLNGIFMAETSRLAGVIGGMGPDATIDFMAKVIAYTPADRDQDHVRMLVDHNPHVPDRQAAILSGGDDPGPALASMAAGLEAAGAEFLVMPCNTAHVFQNAIRDATSIPLISIIDETISAITEKLPDADAVGVLATDGCLRAGIYQAAFVDKGLSSVLPTDGELKELMVLISRIKAGDRGDDVVDRMGKLALALVDRGAQVIIAGCTEIPLVLDDERLSVSLISSTDVLARKTVALALREVPLPGQDKDTNKCY